MYGGALVPGMESERSSGGGPGGGGGKSTELVERSSGRGRVGIGVRSRSGMFAFGVFMGGRSNDVRRTRDGDGGLFWR
jgi:hypothetical protein